MSRYTRPAAAAVLGFCFDQLVIGGLRGVWVRGALPPGGCVWAANHHSWWDGFVANSALREAGRTPALTMDAANLRRFAFLSNLGALPADRPRVALASLAAGHTLIVFPEAELRAAGPLGPVAPGAAWLADKAAVPLVLAATRIVLRGQQKAEAYIDLTVSESHRVERELAARLMQLDTELASNDPRSPLPSFRRVVAGRRSWDERINHWSELAHR